MSRLSKLLGLTLIIAVGWLAAPAQSFAGRVVATIDLSAQRMYVSVDGRPIYAWSVSTARNGYRTPVGAWRPTRMHREYYSKKYHGSPMPHSIFFTGGYAVHGSYAIKSLGRPASHGCVRLHPDNARILFNLVLKNGPKNALIRVRY